MSVFTPVSRDQLLPWLAAHGIHGLHEHRGISGGTVNTNYWLTTASGDWILTLVEDRPASAVRPIMALMQALSQAGLPVPAVRAGADGELVDRLQDRPATLVQALPGDHPAPTPDICAAVGRFLADLHQQHPALDPLPLNFGPDWQQARADYWQHQLPAADSQLLARTLARVQSVWARRWPEAWVHADLFPDNVLSVDGEITAVIDWYFASRGPRLWDLAIALNAFCGSAGLAEPAPAAMLQGYAAGQRLRADEAAALPIMRCSAALRFWLSRLDAEATHQTLTADHAVTIKPPAEYRDLLLELEQKA